MMNIHIRIKKVKSYNPKSYKTDVYKIDAEKGRLDLNSLGTFSDYGDAYSAPHSWKALSQRYRYWNSMKQ